MKRHAWILTLGLTLLPPAHAQASAPSGGLHLRPATAVDTPATLVVEGLAPGRRAFLVLCDEAHTLASQPRPWAPTVAGSTVRQVALADGDGRAQFSLAEAAFRAEATLAVVVRGDAGLWEWGSLRLPSSVPICPVRSTDPQARLSSGPSRRLLVTEFMKDPVAVSDSRGEWIEVLNPGSTPVDLTGWILADEGNDATVLTAGNGNLTVPPFGFLVLGRQLDPALNGGVAVDATYSGLTLSNGADEIVLAEPNGFVADFVRYDDGVLWPDVPGASVSMSPRAWFTGLDDRGVVWCPGETALPGGDLGTPGAFNDTCGG